MSNLPVSAGVRLETLGSASGDGTLVTSGAANTKGSYAAIGTTGFAYHGFYVDMFAQSNGDAFRIDVSINVGGTRTVIVADMFTESEASTVQSQFSFHCPVAVKAGAALEIRIQAIGATRTQRFVIRGYALDAPADPGASRIVSLTAWTNTNPTGNITQNGTTQTATFTEIISATPCAIKRIWFSPADGGDTTRTVSSYEVEVFKGAGGSETSFCKFNGRQLTGTIIPQVIEFPCMIPAGTRLSFKVTCSAAAADTFGVAAWGLAA